jgi:NADPH2:quinone reductase
VRAWRVHQYGEPRDVLTLDDVEAPEPGPGEVRVRVLAFPLNLNDLERVTGGNMMARPEFPYSPGMEVMGVADACGDGVGLAPGSRIVATTKEAHGGFAELALCPAVSTFPVPDELALPEAAAFYFPFHLAWLGLVDRAAVAAGETVLIHAAAGGSGSAAVQLAKHLGARVIATAGTEEKLALCRELGADVAVNYRDGDYKAAVLEATGGRGVEVVFDNVGEAVFEDSLACTAYDGRYLMMGFASHKEVADEPFVVPRRIALGNLKLCGVLFAYAAPDIEQLVKTAMGWNFVPASRGREIHDEILGLLASGAVRPVVGSTVPFAGVPGALEALARRETVGRTVVLVDEAG